MRGKTNSVTTSGGSSESTLKKLLDTTKSARYLFYDYKGTSVDDLIAYSDTENVTIMNDMFEQCTNITSIPLINTSKVTSMFWMFRGCSKLTSIPFLDTSNVTNMSSMFFGTKLASIPLLNTSKVNNMTSMFSGCKSLTSIPLLDTSSVTNTNYMFEQCSKLTSIPALDVSKVTNMDYMFSSCYNLESIHMTGMKVSFSISSSTKFTTEALHEIITNLATVTSSKQLIMGSTNLAKVSEEYKAIATNKGWTLA